MRRVYLLPLVARDAEDPTRVPKYLEAMGLGWRLMPNGLTPLALVLADTDDTQHATLVANADVAAVPALDSSVTAGNIGAVQSALETRLIPAGWITVGMTFRQVVRGIAQIFLLAQRLHARSNLELVPGGATLDTRFNQLSQSNRTALTGAAQSLGLDTSGVGGNATLRVILRGLAQQLQQTIRLGKDEPL